MPPTTQNVINGVWEESSTDRCVHRAFWRGTCGFEFSFKMLHCLSGLQQQRESEESKDGHIARVLPQVGGCAQPRHQPAGHQGSSINSTGLPHWPSAFWLLHGLFMQFILFSRKWSEQLNQQNQPFPPGLRQPPWLGNRWRRGQDCYQKSTDGQCDHPPDNVQVPATDKGEPV